MSILEIVVFGYVANVMMLLVMLVLTVIYISALNKFNVKNTSEIMYLQNLGNKLKNLKNECRRKKILVFFQERFIIFVPFSYAIYFFTFMYHVLKSDLLEFLIFKMDYYISIYEEALRK